MNSNQEGAPKVAFSHPLQEPMTEIFMQWEQSHAGNGTKTGIDTNVLEPNTRPEQDITCAMVPVMPEALKMPAEVLFGKLQQNLAESLGSAEKADQFVDDLRHAHSSRLNTTPLLETIDIIVGQGKNIGVLFEHQVLSDVGWGMGAIAIARGKTDALKQNVILLNKAKTFGAIGDKPIVDALTPFSSIVFVSPKTESAKQRQVPDEISSLINYYGSKALRPFIKRGALVAVALHGTSLKPEYTQSQSEDAPATLAYRIPEMDSSSASLTDKLDYFLRMAIFKDPQTGEVSWNIGPIEVAPRKPNTRLSQEEKKIRSCLIADDQQRKLAEQFQSISGIETIYEPLIPADRVGELALAGFLTAWQPRP